MEPFGFFSSHSSLFFLHPFSPSQTDSWGKEYDNLFPAREKRILPRGEVFYKPYIHIYITINSCLYHIDISYLFCSLIILQIVNFMEESDSMNCTVLFSRLDLLRVLFSLFINMSIDVK